MHLAQGKMSLKVSRFGLEHRGCGRRVCAHRSARVNHIHLSILDNIVEQRNRRSDNEDWIH